MSDWTSGYVADIGYTYGYYTELNPFRANLACLSGGWSMPAGGTHCELGFGQGVSINIHAAASGGVWYGTDFNPAQAAFAQSLAAAAGTAAHLYDQSFQEFCTRADLPDFDSISLHGIWSWISDENRTIIVDFVRRKLKVGGVLYISYNTQPGWAAMVPMRDLLTEHSEVMGAPGSGIVKRIDGALDFAGKLLESNPAYAKANPQVAERIKRIKDQNRNYVAHEYFNRDWQPMSFARMASWLAPTKLSYACSAYFQDHLDPINLSDAQQALLKELPDPMFRETVRDFCVNQQFRRDYWIKGPLKLSPVALGEAWRKQVVVLLQAREDVALKITAGLGEVSMQEAVYVPILDALADHQARSLAYLEKQLFGKSIQFNQIIQAVTLLVGTGALATVQDEATVERARVFTDKLNLHLMDKARGTADVACLASPVTGGGLTVMRFSQLFLLARSKGLETPQDWAGYCWSALKAQGQRVIKGGQALVSDADNLAELTRQAHQFEQKQLPVLVAVGIA